MGAKSARVQNPNTKKTSSAEELARKAERRRLLFTLLKTRGLWLAGALLFFYEQQAVLKVSATVFWCFALIALAVAAGFPQRNFVIRPASSKRLNALIVAFCAVNAGLFWFSPMANALSLWLKILMLLACTAGSLIFLWPFCTWICEPGESRQTAQISHFLDSNGFLYLMLAVAAAFSVLMIGQAFSKHVWIDESFTMEMISKPVFEMISLTAQDVHPPLFYLLLKFGTSILTFVIPGLNRIYAARLICEIPYLLLIGICAWQVTKRFGPLVGALGVFAIFGMPQIFMYSTELRMYGLSMLWIVCLALAVYDLASGFTPAKNAWIRLMVFSLLAAYTHYYAAVAAAFLWFALLFWFYKTRQSHHIQYWFKAVGFCYLGYLPWLVVLYFQLKAVKADYWISPMTGKSAWGFFEFAYAMGMPLILFFIGFALLCKKQISELNRWFCISCLLLPNLVIAFGILLSLAFRPVYLERYVFGTLLVFWIGLFLLMASLHNPKLKIVFVLVILILGSSRFAMELGWMRQDADGSLRLEQLITEEMDGRPKSDVVLVAGNTHLWRNLHIMLDEKIYLREGLEQEEPITEKVYGKAAVMDMGKTLQDALDARKEVLLIGYANEFKAYEANPAYKVEKLSTGYYGRRYQAISTWRVTLAQKDEAQNPQEPADAETLPQDFQTSLNPAAQTLAPNGLQDSSLDESAR